MSDPFGLMKSSWKLRLWEKVSGPGADSLLRCFQFISPETIPYGASLESGLPVFAA